MLNPVDDSDLQQQQQQEPSNRNSSSSSDIPILPFASDRMNRSPSPVPRQSGQGSNPFGIQSGIVPQRTRMLFGPPGSPNVAQLPPARGSDELKMLQQQLQQINSTLEATKTSDAACQKALKEAKDALEACRKALEAPNIPDQFVQDLAKTKAQLKKAMEQIKEKDVLIDGYIKISDAIEKERIQHNEKLEEMKSKIAEQKTRASTIAGELAVMSTDYKECQRELKRQNDQVDVLRNSLSAETADKKTLAKQLEAERNAHSVSIQALLDNVAVEVAEKKNLENQLEAQRRQAAEDAEKVEKIKKQIFWDILINTAYPKWQWQKLTRALKIKIKSITLEDVQERMKKEGIPPEWLEEKAPSEQKVKQEDPASKDLVMFSDMKDDAPQSMALVARPIPMRDLSDCEEDLKRERDQKLQAEIKLHDQVEEHKAKLQALRDRISDLNARLFVAQKENNDLKNSISSNPLDMDDDVKEEEEEEEEERRTR
jgi:chromosome segregation ATPase